MLCLVLFTTGCGERKTATHEELIEYIKKLPVTKEIQESHLLADDALLDECDAILAALTGKGVSAAFKRIRRLSLVSDSELAEVEKMTNQQLAVGQARLGDIMGYERISSRQIGDSITECVYIAKCEKHVLRWRFYFYKPKDKWMLNTFFWDDQIQEL